MNINLTCSQISALLPFYIDDKLSEKMKEFVETHLKYCAECRKKVDLQRKMKESVKVAQKSIATYKARQEKFCEKLKQDELRQNISAYIDNELKDDENIKVKKLIISNPDARLEFDNMYKLKKSLNSSFEKTKNETKVDYTKAIFREIDFREEILENDIFERVVAIFVLISAIFTAAAFFIFKI